MGESKEDLLKRLDEIHEALAESRKFVPYDCKMLIVWGVIALSLIVFAEPLFRERVAYGMVFLVGMILLGFAIEYLLTKKENRKYDLAEFTKLQRFAEVVYGFNVIFGIVLSVIFVKFHLVGYAYLSWVFLLGVSGYMLGFVINSKSYLNHGKISVVASLILLIVNLFQETVLIDRLFAIVTIGLGYIYLGMRSKKECENV